MEQLIPFALFILLLIASTVFSKKADEAQKKDQERNGAKPGRTAPAEPPEIDAYGDDLPTASSPVYEDIPFEAADLGGDRRVTLDADDLAREMLQDNAHLAKHLAELDRWNSHSR